MRPAGFVPYVLDLVFQSAQQHRQKSLRITADHIVTIIGISLSKHFGGRNDGLGTIWGEVVHYGPFRTEHIAT